MFLLKHWNLGVKFQKLKNPISTRLNSAFTNMSSVLHLKAPVPVWEQQHQHLAPLAFSVPEWKLVGGAVTVLNPFLLVTKACEAEKSTTINLNDQAYTAW